MLVIAGLGNPGRKYENTKHNMGFLVLDAFAEKNSIRIRKIKHKALVGEGIIAGQKVLLVKPQTYMNLSGESLREVVQYYDVEPEELMVVYDDVDIPMGSIRLRKKGSAGSHNGMKSIIYQLQFDDFPRLRVGIGTEKKGDMIDFVLTGFSKEESAKIREAIETSVSAMECWIERGIDIAMNEYNPKKKPKKPKEEPETEGAESAGEANERTVSGDPGDRTTE
jgi:PTH1 family peptidyl-tRNA hydrolase